MDCSLWLVLSPTNDMIVLGTVRTPTRGGTRSFAGTTPEGRAEPAYNTQVLLSKIKLLSSRAFSQQFNRIIFPS